MTVLVKTAMAAAQAILKFSGSPSLVVDGTWGPKSRDAVSKAKPETLIMIDKTTNVVAGKKLSDIVPAITMSKTQGEVVFKAVVVPQLIEACKRAKIRPAPVIAQIALESGWGTSELAYKDLNYGGLKYNSVYYVPGIKVGEVWYTSPEYENGKLVRRRSKFAKFASVEDFIATYIWYLTKSNSVHRFKGLVGAKSDYDHLLVMYGSGYATDIGYQKKMDEMLYSVKKRYSALT